MAAHLFYNQGCLGPDFKRDCGARRYKVDQTKWDLCCPIHQRIAVVLHPKGIQGRSECSVPHIGAGEVSVRHDRQATNGSIDEPSEVETGDQPITVILENDLRTLEAELEVSRQHLLNCLGMAENVSRFGAGFRHEAVETDGRETARNGHTGNAGAGVGMRAISGGNEGFDTVKFQRAGSSVTFGQQAVITIHDQGHSETNFLHFQSSDLRAVESRCIGSAGKSFTGGIPAHQSRDTPSSRL